MARASHHWGVGGMVALGTVRPWWAPGCRLLAARALNIYVEIGLGLTGITSIPDGQREEFLRLARWFLFLWFPWYTLGAVAWGALAIRIYPRPHLDGMPRRWARPHR